MTKFVIFLIVSLLFCAGGIFEHMNDVITLSLIAAGIFTLKIWHKVYKKVKKNEYQMRSQRAAYPYLPLPNAPI